MSRKRALSGRVVLVAAATVTVIGGLVAGIVSAFATPAGAVSSFPTRSSGSGCTVTWTAVRNISVREAQFYAVAADAPDDAWAVGGAAIENLNPDKYAAPRALTAHWDGRRWQLVPNPLGISALEGVAVIARNDAWAVGERSNVNGPPQGYGLGAVAAHWDGARWRRVSLPGLRRLAAVAATSTRDVWAVGVGARGSAIVIHWNGKRWQTRLRLPETELHDVSALSPRDVWVSGDRPDPEGRFIEAHWDGRHWSRYAQLPPSGRYGVDPNPQLVAIDAVAANDVWAAGDAAQAGGPAWPDTVLFHWTGERWQKAQPPHLVWVKDLSVRVPGELWLATITGNGDAAGNWTLERRLGTRWTGQTLGAAEVAALASDQAQGLWAVGSVGSDFNALGFAGHERPLIAHGRCS